jgi:hypothetical protein
LLSIISPYVADFVFRNSDSVGVAGNSADQQRDARDAKPPTATEDQQPSAEYQPDCAKSTNADLCAQRRMAKSAEDQVGISELGMWLLGATLVFTAGAAVASGLTVWAMKDGTKRQLRAYVAAVPTRIEGLSPTTKSQVSYRITNHGFTPAHNLRHAAVLTIAPHPLPDNYPFPELGKPGASIVLHPNSALPFTARVVQSPFAETELVEILAGSDWGKGNRLYVFAQIDYLDAFKNPHWTRMCASFQGRPELPDAAASADWERVAALLKGSGEGGLFSAADQHNETDDG